MLQEVHLNQQIHDVCQKWRIQQNLVPLRKIGIHKRVQVLELDFPSNLDLLLLSCVAWASNLMFLDFGFCHLSDRCWVIYSPDFSQEEDMDKEVEVQRGSVWFISQGSGEVGYWDPVLLYGSMALSLTIAIWQPHPPHPPKLSVWVLRPKSYFHIYLY